MDFMIFFIFIIIKVSLLSLKIESNTYNLLKLQTKISNKLIFLNIIRITIIIVDDLFFNMKANINFKKDVINLKVESPLKISSLLFKLIWINQNFILFTVLEIQSITFLEMLCLIKYLGISPQYFCIDLYNIFFEVEFNIFNEKFGVFY